MPLAVVCPHCGKQFNAKDELAGKRVKCSQCAGVISIPAASAAAPANPAARSPAKPAGGNAVAQPAKRGAAPATMGTNPMRQPGPMQQPPHMQQPGGVADILDDNKMGELVSATILRPGETMCPNCRAAVPMGGSMCVKCGFDFRAGKVFRTVVPKPPDPRIRKTLGALGALALVIVGIVVTSGLLIAVPIAWNSFGLEKIDIAWKNYGMSAIVLGGALTLLFNASILADAFKEGPGRGLMYLFVPGYSIYFICTRWSICAKPFFASLISAWLLYTGIFIYTVGKRIEDAKPPEPKGFARLSPEPFTCLAACDPCVRLGEHG
jgi:predicted Zn finger-like uncharacterized protein